MKRHTLNPGRFALTGAAAAALLLCTLEASALGLGRLSVQSSLGETLRAEIDVTSLTAEEASTLRVRVAPPESYRSAGVDYNAVLPTTQTVIERRPDGRAFLRITSERPVQEPFVDVILELTWSTGRLVREYTLLLDPPSTRNMASAPPAVTTAPSMSSAPAAPSAAAPAARAERRPAPVAPMASAPAAAPAASPAMDAEYLVQPGDTLSRIAAKTQRSGASLEQMLVSLYQGNPQAFINNNMNRLRAGVVLNVPSAEAATAISPAEARQTIQVQSADFSAYRQRLAGLAAPAQVEGSGRQAAGSVQTSVDDAKQASVATPDKLTLTKGAAAAKAAEEAAISKERQEREEATRVAELAKNVEELKRLSGSTAAASAATGTATAPAAAAATGATTAAAPAVPQIAVAAAPPLTVPAPSESTAPDPVSAASDAAAPADTATASAQPPVAEAPAAAPAPAVAAAPVQAASPGLMETLMEDNPLGLALGGGLIALLAGFGIYRFTRRSKKDSGETSFLESRLQPDSFFGASGGQRIDTRDASGASSSMSYSLSQLDAIGDVDPVAEADVYLAYGRDLQAEEILKEAMRGNPDRLAIRTKLLEVYAKRRDTKGFEMLAIQLFGLTNGTGEDWAKAQELGQQIDYDNPLYQAGGAPVLPEGEMPRPEPLGASTMPHSVMPSQAPTMAEPAQPMKFGEQQPFDSDPIDLELDLGGAGGGRPAEPAAMPRNAQPLATRPDAQAPQSLDVPDLDFSLDDVPAFESPKAAAPAPSGSSAHTADGAMNFDLSSISLDLDEPTTSASALYVNGTQDDAQDMDLGSDDDDGRDPLERKLDLAEEFRQIGDMEGARDLLQEVVAKANGSLRSKAQGMLSTLA